jgi:hypothetical protein
LVEALILAGVSAILYNLGVGLPLFLVPLQIVRVRKGGKAFLLASGVALLATFGVRLTLSSRTLGPASGPFLLLELVLLLGLVGGLAWIQLPELSDRPARLPGGRAARLLTAAAAAGLVSIPLILYLRASQAFTGTLGQIFSTLAGVLNQVSAQSLDLNPGEQLVKPEQLQAMVGSMLLRSYLADYVLLLVFSWWAGSLIGARSAGRPSGVTRLQDFRLPEGYVWPLIGSLAVVALGQLVRIGAAEIAAWNLALIMLFLYGLAGLGILRFLLARAGAPGGLWVGLILMLIVLAFIPRVNLAIAILIPGLGVSETWIKYRRERSRK